MIVRQECECCLYKWETPLNLPPVEHVDPLALLFHSRNLFIILRLLSSIVGKQTFRLFLSA